MRTSSNTNKTNLNTPVPNSHQADGGYIVWLTTTLNPEKSAESALLLADKMNVSISKMMHLLSRKPGPLSKAISKEKALKLAKVLESVGVKTEVISRDRLLQDKSKQVSKKTTEPKLANRIKLDSKKKITKSKESPEQKEAALEQKEANTSLESEAPIKVDIDDILDRINAKATATTQLGSEKKKPKWRSRSLVVLMLLSFALGISYLVTNFSEQITSFSQNLISPVNPKNTSGLVEENLNPVLLRELNTSDLLSLANAGAPKAQYELAFRYSSKKNYDSAVKWLIPSAETGYPEAQYLLGLFYQYGHGVEHDNIQSLLWLTKASEQGLAEAQYRLGLMHLEGLGTTVDTQKAISLLTLASQQDNNDASLKLNDLQNPDQLADIFSIATTASPAQLLVWLEPNQNLNIKDKLGQTPLMYAASHNTAESIQILINLGADLNLITEDGWTALMYASRDNPEVIKTLLINSAKPDILNSNGQTALDIAKENYENAEEYFVLDEF